MREAAVWMTRLSNTQVASRFAFLEVKMLILNSTVSDLEPSSRHANLADRLVAIDRESHYELALLAKMSPGVRNKGILGKAAYFPARAG